MTQHEGTLAAGHAGTRRVSMAWRMRRAVLVAVACAGLASVAALGGCSNSQSESSSLTLATTTSTRDTGLLDMLLPLFQQSSGIDVKVVAVGTGQALEIGRRGDADVLLTHAPDAEAKFVAEGHGEARREVMFNDFILVGPAADPAHVKGQAGIADAFRLLAESKSTFVSRGDESGTHIKENAIWAKAAIAPEGEWYLAAGSGMAATLRLASEKKAYTLTDRGTFLSQKDQLDLAVLSEGDPMLRNIYAVTVVNPSKHEHVNYAAARRLADFLCSPDIQNKIGQFGVDKYGQALFTPMAKTP